MASIKYHDDENTQYTLEAELVLRTLETTAEENMSEGWIHYTLDLRRNGKELIATRGTIHDYDVRAIEKLFENPTKKGDEYEPLEPDFTVAIIDHELHGEVQVTFVVNYGHANTMIYDGSGIGIKIPLTKHESILFGAELKKERITLTKDIEFHDYEEKKIS